MQDITRALREFDPEDEDKKNRLFKLVYQEVEEIAERLLRKFPRINTLSPADIVGELYIKLEKRSDLSFEDRTSFYRYTCRVMSNLLIDYMRKKRNKVQFVTASDELGLKNSLNVNELMDLQKALEQLYKVKRRLGEVAELRIYGGLSREELASHLQVTERTITRDLKEIRGMLNAMLAPPH